LGGYTPDLYRQYLRALRMTEEQLASELKKEVVQEQLALLLADLNVVSEGELQRAYGAAEQKFAFQYVKFLPASFEPQVQTSDEAALRSHYEANKEKYRTAKKVRFAAAALKPEQFTGEVKLTEEDLKDSYSERMNEFVEPRQYKLQKIVYRFEKEKEEGENQSSINSKDAKKKIADETLEKLKSGEGFEKLARERSEDPETKEKGGDMGWLMAEDLPENILDAIQTLARGEFTGVIEGESELTITRLEELKEARQKSFDEVRAEIEADFREAEAPMYAHARGEQLLGEWRGGAQPLEEFAKLKAIAVVTAEKPLGAGQASHDLPAELTDRAMPLGAGAKELIDIEDIPYLLEVLEIADPAIPPFEEVREAVVKSYTKSKSAELAKEKAQTVQKQLAEEAKKRKSELDLIAKSSEKKEIPSLLQQAAAGEKLEVKETKEGTKAELSEEFLAAAAAKSAAFGLTPSHPAGEEPLEANGSFYAVQLRRVVPAPRDNFAEKKTGLIKSEHDQGGQRLERALVQALRNSADIWVNTEALEANKRS
jgi:peptidyl-prolyl cis-trans isomerase D